jgi:transitional endoplasmic reticulum ATPase
MFPHLRPTAHISLRGVDTCPLSLKWAHQILLELGAHRAFISRHGLGDEGLAIELGLVEWIDHDDYTQAKALSTLRRQSRKFHAEHPSPQYPDRLGANLIALGKLLDLDDAALQVMGFCILLQSDPVLAEATDQLGLLGYNRTLKVLSVLLGQSLAQVEACVGNNSVLTRAGLLEIGTEAKASMHLSAVLGIPNQQLPMLLRFSQSTAIDFFNFAFRRSPTGILQYEHYVHLKRPLEIAERYLRKALESRRCGVNILVYGPPGTGKTQLSRLLAERLGCYLYEVACTDREGDPVAARQRLCALRAANSVLRSQRALLVLDEIEDIFNSADSEPGSRSQKGWINRMLEENAKPSFWLSNSIEAIDAAHTRRFDLVIEVPNPPLVQREELIRNCSDNRLGDVLVAHLSAHEEVTPAIVQRAVRVARSVSPRVGKHLDSTVRAIVDSTLKAQGFNKLRRNDGNGLPSLYSPEWINADLPLAGLVEGLRAHPQARLCFYGPPGTGKTAFGRWLAQELDKPLLVKRVSDLVSPYVGMTEKNLAAAFERAEDEDAVLMLDEVDSFLQDRRNARHGWEVSSVNEMLTQMESYQGLFIASTNLIRDLDEASLRRFDLKVHFGYLVPAQAQTLFAAHIKTLGLKDPQKAAAQQLSGEAHLTPGDFAAVARRGCFKPFTTAAELADALIAECRLKSTGQNRPIGFIH